MPRDNRTDRPSSHWPRLTLGRADQATAAVFLVTALAIIAAHWTYHGRFRGRLIEIDRAVPRVVDFKIDINQADWPELCLMPSVGEQLSKRIVEDRQTRGPFRDLQDLRRVPGIGPKTLEGMRSYLLPLADVEATAGGSDGEAAARTP